MRVTDSQRFNSLQNNLATSLDAYNTVQQEISTGKQMNALSDNPGGGAQALALRAALVDNAQYQRNVASANTFLTSSESAINDAVTLVTSAHTIALQPPTPECRIRIRSPLWARRWTASSSN